MVSLAVIAKATGVPNPDFNTVLRYLEDIAKPIAVEKDPLKIIAPAINRFHHRAESLQYGLKAKNLDARRLKNLVTRGFSRITALYVILKGIQAPDDLIKRRQFNDEVIFARKLLEIAYRLYREIGGTPELKWDAVMLPENRRNFYIEEIKALRSKYPFPEFALKHNLEKRSAVFAGAGWIFLLIFILADTGILPLIISAIKHALSDD